MSRQLRQPFGVGASQPDDRQRPFDDTRGDVGISLYLKAPLHLRLFHGKGIASALKMIVTEDRAAHNRQIGIGADKVMRELPYEIKQPRKRVPVYLHGNMPAVEHNAVLIVIDIG